MYHDIVHCPGRCWPLVQTASTGRIEVIVSSDATSNVAVVFENVNFSVKAGGCSRIASGGCHRSASADGFVPYRVGFSNETELATTIYTTLLAMVNIERVSARRSSSGIHLENKKIHG